MPGRPATYFEVKFLPDGLRVEVVRGATILEAARKAGIKLRTLCGGDGICGKCRVVLEEGRVESVPTTLLSREDILNKVLLACQSRVESNAVISIPAESRLEDASRILLDKDAERFRRLGPPGAEDVGYAFAPLVRKLKVEMEPPTTEQGVADHERLYHAIESMVKVPRMQTGFSVLQSLPAVLRKCDWKVWATVAWRGSVAEVVQVEPCQASAANYGVAVDVGTTTVVAHLVDLATGALLDAQATYNSQMQWGEDYIHRIIYAEQNDALGELQQSITTDVNNLISALVDTAGVRLHDINAMVASGNTAMIHFLLGLDPSGIRRAPYVPSANFIPPIRAAQIGIHINGRGLLYCLPGVAAYIGSDIVAGVLATGLDRAEELTLFVDLGTNGEVVLGNREFMFAASSSAGPAFEGGGVRHGMRAADGAIEALRFDEGGRVHYRTVNNSPPKGICGSGLLDVLAELYMAGVLDRTGRFDASRADERFRMIEGNPEFSLVPKGETDIDSDIVITQHDIENLIRSKAGVFAAIHELLAQTGVEAADVDQILLGGGFGNYLDVAKAVTIGMLPDIPRERIHFVGNTSMRGAKMAMLSVEAYSRAEEIASRMTYVDLMTNPHYMEEFISAKFLPHTNIELFPSVARQKVGDKK